MNVAWTVLLADSYWGMHGDVGTGWMIVMMIGMLVFWGAVILGIVWLARGSFAGWRGERRETPLEILERRFAEGDISSEEYQDRRAVITSSSGVSRDAPSAPARN